MPVPNPDSITIAAAIGIDKAPVYCVPGKLTIAGHAILHKHNRIFFALRKSAHQSRN
jgi:hypothetical protein